MQEKGNKQGAMAQPNKSGGQVLLPVRYLTYSIALYATEINNNKRNKKGLPAPLVEYVQSLSKILIILYPKLSKNQ